MDEDWVVICMGSGVNVHGTFHTLERADRWLGEQHCTDRFDLKDQPIARDEWQCTEGVHLVDHHVEKVQAAI